MDTFSRPYRITVKHYAYIPKHPGLSDTHATTEDALVSQRIQQISDATVNLVRPSHRLSVRLFTLFTIQANRRRCMVFATGGTVEFIHLAPHPNSSTDVFDVSSIFPNSASSARVTCIPGTPLKLNTDYRIIVSRFIECSLHNTAVDKLFSIQWARNVVVAKYDQNGNADDINSEEIQFIVAILAL